jgi:predicted MFS family arabinose efflux permease
VVQSFSESPISPESQRTRRYVLCLLFLVAAFNLIDRQLMGLLVEPIKNEFGVSDSTIGILTGFSFAFFHAIAGIPIARWADVGSRRTIISIGLALWSLLTVCSGLAQNFGQLAIARMGVGVGEAAGTPPSHSLLSDYYPPEERAKALAIVSIGASTGLIVAFLLGGWLAQHLGWRWTFVVFGAPGILLALILRMTVEEPERGRFDPVQTREPSSALETLRFMLGLRAYRNVLAAASLHAFVTFSGIFWFPAFIARTQNLGIAQIGTILALTTPTFIAFGTYLGGRIVDRNVLRDVRWHVWPSAMATITAAPFLLALLFTQSAWGLVLLAPMSFLMGLALPGLHAATQILAKPRMRAVSSAFNLIALSVVGSGLGTALIGIATDQLSSRFGQDAIRYSLLMSVVAALGAGIFSWRAAESLERDIGALVPSDL